LLCEFLLESSNPAKTISNVIDVENRKGANFVYDLDTREYGICDRSQLLRVRQHTEIIVNNQFTLLMAIPKSTKISTALLVEAE